MTLHPTVQQVHAIRCPKCSAKPGKDCREDGREMAASHLARIEKVRAGLEKGKGKA